MSRRLARAAAAFLAAASMFLSLSSSVVAQATPEVWTPELAMRYRAVGGVTISPDGNRVAYTVRHAEMEGSTSKYVSQVWIANADGSGEPAVHARVVVGFRACLQPRRRASGVRLVARERRREGAGVDPAPGWR